MTRASPPTASELPAGLGPADALASTEARSPLCLTTDELLLLVLGQLPDPRRATALEHVDRCLDCQLLLAGAAQALRDTGDLPRPSPTGVFAVGDRVANRYRVERFIARGGMGEIYAVHDTVLDEAVALKTVRGASPSDEKAIRRLKSEAQLSRKIGHPHTCRIYEFGEHEAGGWVVYFFTMALVEGETLGVKLRRDGPLKPELVAVVARQVLAGLAEAHALGVLHRDLKSDNIMLRSQPGPGLAIDAVIMDFGLAMRLDSDDRLTSDSHALVGSAAYMAPEQVEGEKLTPAADIYAFGVILFEMLTGRLPFRGPTLAATALKRLRQVAPVPSSIRAGLDPIWDAVVLRCLERSPELRFGSASEVLGALDGSRADLPPRKSKSALHLQNAGLVLGAVALVLAGLFGVRSWLDRARTDRVPGSALTVPTSTAPPSPSPLPLAPAPEEGPAAAAEPLPPAAPSHHETSTAAPGANERSAATPAPSARTHGKLRPVRALRLKMPASPSDSTPPAAAPASEATEVPAIPGGASSPAEPRDVPVGPLPIDTEFPR